MTAALTSLLGSWWTRLFRRSHSPRIRSLAEASAIADAATKAPVPVTPPQRSDERAATAAEQAQSFMETVCAQALPTVTLRPPPRDPQVRERTLAALANLKQIPALQSLAQGFLRALNQTDVAFEEVVDAIGKDSALCVRVLRMANSVLVSPERRIEDIETAVHMLGVTRVRQTAQALFTLRDAHRVAEGFDWRHLWIHALATATIAEELARSLRDGDTAQLHLAALLHDVGKIVLSTVAPEDYRGVLVTAWNESAPLEPLERERLGVDHREAGVLFARAAGMPELVVQAIGHHDAPERAAAFRFECALVAVADYLSKVHGLGFSGARVTEGDDFQTLAAWEVIAAEIGAKPDVAALERDLTAFVPKVRAELRALRES